METIVTSGGQTDKICEACGQFFACGAGTGECWCMKVYLNAEKLKVLRETYEDCLCRNCLSQREHA